MFRFINKVILASVLTSFASTVGAQEELRARDVPRPIISAVQFEARGRDGAQILYQARRGPGRDGVIISVRTGKVRTQHTFLSASRFPDVDLASVEISYQETFKEPHITLRFGNDEDCSSSYDRRAILEIVFHRYSVTTHVERQCQ